MERSAMKFQTRQVPKFVRFFAPVNWTDKTFVSGTDLQFKEAQLRM
jgi:hypothetical protein